MIGSIVNADINRFPALTAEFVMLASAVIAITSKAENLLLTISTPFARGDMSKPLVAALTPSKPFAAPVRSRLFLSWLSVPMLVCTFFSN